MSSKIIFYANVIALFPCAALSMLLLGFAAHLEETNHPLSRKGWAVVLATASLGLLFFAALVIVATQGDSP